MGYDVALKKAWSQLQSLATEKIYSVKFLADEYTIDVKNQRILSLSCNAPAKEYYSILILHYLIKKTEGLPLISGNWISFKELDGGQGYFPAFKKRAIEPIIRKYGSNPDSILDIIERFPAKSVQFGDIGIVIEAFENVPLLITLYRGDEEFSPEANILFDRSISNILCTEDVVVLSGIVASLI